MILPSTITARLVWIVAIAWVPWMLAWAVGIGTGRWWIAIWLPLGPYVAALCALAVAAAIATRRWNAVLAAFLGLAVVTSTFHDRLTRDEQPATERGVPFTVLALNLDQGRADASAVMALVRREQVDAAAFVELTQDGLDRLDAAGLAEAMPHRQAVPGAASGGIGAFSRHPSAWDAELLPPDRPWMPALIQVPGVGPVRFEAMRAPPPRPKTAGRFRAENPLALLPAGRPDQPPLIVAGDLNASLDSHHLRAFLGRGYRDAAEETGRGMVATWTQAGGLARLTLDHVLVSPTVGVRDVKVIPIPGTDHRAVVAHLELPAAPAR